MISCYIFVIAPRPPFWGLAGPFFLESTLSTGWLFIDYQNLHHTAGECFESPGTPPEDYLVHPDRFATEVENAWPRVVSDTKLEVHRVDVFRGLPDPRKDPQLNSYISKHNAAWNAVERVNVHTRPLRYPRDWPTSRAEEKGIDVLLALFFFRAAIMHKTDYVIMASRDSDQMPTIEMAQGVKNGVEVAIATWTGSSILRPKVAVPTVQLGATEFGRARANPDGT